MSVPGKRVCETGICPGGPAGSFTSGPDNNGQCTTIETKGVTCPSCPTSSPQCGPSQGVCTDGTQCTQATKSTACLPDHGTCDPAIATEGTVQGTNLCSFGPVTCDPGYTLNDAKSECIKTTLTPATCP